MKCSDIISFGEDSLLNGMSIKRMNVRNYRGVKLTKPGDSLDGTVNRVQGSIYWGGGNFPPKRISFPLKVLLKKKLQLFQIKIFFDDDFKESVKVINVQKCDLSQS